MGIRFLLWEMRDYFGTPEHSVSTMLGVGEGATNEQKYLGIIIQVR